MNNFSNSENFNLKSFFEKFKTKPIISQIIIINTAIWLILNIISVVNFLFVSPNSSSSNLWQIAILKLVSLPANFSSFLIKPWTILTYIFVHTSFFHLLFNMLWLYWFGKIFLEFKSKKDFIFVYIASGIAGAVLYLLAYNFLPAFTNDKLISQVIGASGAILGVTFATAIIAPDYNIRLFLIGNVKLKHLVIFTIVLDLLLIKQGNAGGHIVHIGGAIFGVLYSLYIRKRVLLKSKTIKIKNKKEKKFFSKFKKNNTSKEQPIASNMTNEEYNKYKHEKQEKIDTILDKISLKGYKSLTQEEKDFLFKNSGK